MVREKRPLPLQQSAHARKLAGYFGSLVRGSLPKASRARATADRYGPHFLLVKSVLPNSRGLSNGKTRLSEERGRRGKAACRMHSLSHKTHL